MSDGQPTYCQEAADVANEFLDRGLLEEELRREVRTYLGQGEPLEALERIRDAHNDRD